MNINEDALELIGSKLEKYGEITHFYIEEIERYDDEEIIVMVELRIANSNPEVF